MWRFLHRFINYFLVVFVATFVIYLFVRWDADKVFTGMAIGAGVAAVACSLIFWLERRFPDRPPAVD